MIEFIVELIFQTIGEIIIQLLAELALEFGFESLAHSLRGSRDANPFLAAIGLIFLGGFAGAVSAWVLPHRLAPIFGFRGISLLVAPIATGMLMQSFGSWRRERGADPTYLATFWGGALFALVMTMVRWVLVGRAS